ncbi:hypothetical protein IM792_13360 [Mucilaginibacter sp. JRF]|uniref:hypothetical protein n=1 Tax=Mucilaginibacter sp. JRF TaxID=2780088 RepID=UPI00188263F3|nr:hypothetical protein [Mucilaginibacter sp. JRF]MBE9585439.1 hypothetical protein [Mucilaginibacter sp. JRF]
MKKIYTAVSFLLVLAATEACCKQQLNDEVAIGGKEIRQSHRENAHISKPR